LAARGLMKSQVILQLLRRFKRFSSRARYRRWKGKYYETYATLGFGDKANLDDGQMWPTDSR
jgi:hypothetical protein